MAAGRRPVVEQPALIVGPALIPGPAQPGVELILNSPLDDQARAELRQPSAATRNAWSSSKAGVTERTGGVSRSRLIAAVTQPIG